MPYTTQNSSNAQAEANTRAERYAENIRQAEAIVRTADKPRSSSRSKKAKKTVTF